MTRTMNIKPKIIYVYDTLCSWCYAFEGEMQLLFDAYQDKFAFQIVSGGMFQPEQNRRIKDVLGEDFRDAYAQVVAYSGVIISEKYLTGLVADGNYKLDSKKTAKAFAAFKTYRHLHKRQIEFIQTMQGYIYRDGLNPNEDELYCRTAKAFEIDADDFIIKMETNRIEKSVVRDFHYAQALQVNGFPQVFVKTIDERYYLVARGYDTANHIGARIKELEKDLH